ncbi:MAG: Fis family transcriptional regulator [Gammaproteobacteria bacterium SG8_47]|nr:MAG: Fis family transcriptional regulator [Gammaproteobacteria bacterium SG8_47]
MSETSNAAPGGRLLVIDDEPVAVKNLVYVLSNEGHDVTSAESGPAGLRALQRQSFDVVLTDLRMERVDGMEILRYCREHHDDTAVVVITGFATVSSAVDAMKEGAFHYVAKPFRLDEVRHVVREALELVRLKRENRALREIVDDQIGRVSMITQDPLMKKLLETALQVAPTDCNVVLTGESGTGKELMARYLHAHSARRDEPFVAVNCGAFTEDLLANELFGHEKGAYTGATDTRQGLIEAASSGTLFLDEVTEMSPSMQVKLLRVIQEGELRRLGGTDPIRVDVRYIAATNRDLREAIADGRFRHDLYYRLNVMNLHLPPLSERRSDIPLLAHYFLRKYAAVAKKTVADIAPEAMAVLSSYDYPGNVRELANLIERGVALASGTVLDEQHLPDDLRTLQIRAFRRSTTQLPTLEAQEAEYIRWVLQQTEGNRTRAAEILGIDRVSLWRKLKKYELE